MHAIRFCFASLVLVLSTALALAQDSKFQLDGTTLIYDSTTPGEGESEDIEIEDVDVLLQHLRENEQITTLQLNSNGGDVWSATRMKDIVIGFGLDTHVDGVCESSCITVFLGGTKRTMSRGSVMGFHQVYWSAASMERYYNRHREAENWDTPFAVSEWAFMDTQSEVYAHLSFMLSRGVDPEFAIRSIRRPDASLWRPYRLVLLGAGVLTE